MRRPALPFVVALALTGCSSGDETDSALKPGQVVVVSNPDGVFLHGNAMSKLQPGVRVTVGNDPGEWVESNDGLEDRVRSAGNPAYAKSIRDVGPLRVKPGGNLGGYRLAGRRQLKVTVESGPNAGASGEIERQDVRPIP